MKVAIAVISLLFSLTAKAAVVRIVHRYQVVEFKNKSHHGFGFWLNRYPMEQILVLALLTTYLSKLVFLFIIRY
jgi:hypothetical protein